MPSDEEKSGYSPLLEGCGDISENFDCRICGGGNVDKTDPLLQPCACTGGLGLVHAKCLMKWIKMRPTDNEEEMMRCEICKEKYRVSLSYKFRCDKICE